MTHETFNERVHDYVDGTLSESARREIESHAESCDPCHERLEDLRALRRETRRLEQPEPSERVWAAVSREIRRSRQSAARPYLALAAALLLGVGLWVALGGGPFLDQLAPGASPGAPDEELVSQVTAELHAAESHYAKAIEGLEQIVAQNDGVLPTELDSVLAENLDLIELAIQDSREAMRTEPGSPVAQESLLSALRRKVSLLQNTILLINEIRKGEGESAMDRIDQIRESSDPANPI